MDLNKDMKDLKGKIKALASKESLSDAEATDLEKLMTDAKNIQLRIAAQEFGADENPTQSNEPDPVDEKITKALEPVMKALEKIPGLDSAGYITNMGGTQDPTHKSFGDFCLAIKRGDVKRLKSIYGSIKTLEEDGGTSGGYLVPEEYRNELLKMTATSSQVTGLVTRVPVNTDAGSYPALDQFTAPTAGVGDTAFAAGVKVTTKNESGTLDNNEPVFTEIQYRIGKIGDLVYVSNELNMDSPQSIDGILRALFTIAIAGKEEYFIFRGPGAGQPLGLLNSSAAVAVTTATNNVFSYVDAASMISRFHAYLSPGRFFMHPSVFPDVATWEIGTAGAAAPKLADLGYGAPIFSEHLPQANNAGDAVLADLRAYIFFDRQGMTIDYSEHAAFTTDRVVWRVKERLDGMPWLKGTITLADPTGSYTTSPSRTIMTNRYHGRASALPSGELYPTKIERKTK